MAAPGLYGEFGQGLAQGFSLVQEAQKNKAIIAEKQRANRIAEFNQALKVGDTLSNTFSDVKNPIEVRQSAYNSYRGTLNPFMNEEAQFPEIDFSTVSKEGQKILNGILNDTSQINTLVATGQMSPTQGQEHIIQLKKRASRINEEQAIKTYTGALEQSQKIVDREQKKAENIETEKRKAKQELETARGKEEIKSEFGATSGTITDNAAYVADDVLARKGDKEAEARNVARLSYRRAQADEVTSNRTAEKLVDLEYMPLITKNNKLATRMAEIETAAALSEAKGERTPMQKKEDAARSVSGKLASMANIYLKLDNMGAISNSKRGTMDNIVASMAASDIGQWYGNITGTSAQKYRNMIGSTRPLLMNDIRQASEMGAKGLDSEKELEFYLQAASDPKREISSQYGALIVLDRAYGDGRLSDILKDKVGEDVINDIMQEAGTRPDFFDGGVQKLANKITVVAPDGTNLTFSTQEQADQFKKAAGL